MPAIRAAVRKQKTCVELRYEALMASLRQARMVRTIPLSDVLSILDNAFNAKELLTTDDLRHIGAAFAKVENFAALESNGGEFP